MELSGDQLKTFTNKFSTSKKGKKENDKLVYKFIVSFYSEKLSNWTIEERLLQLPTSKSHPQMFYANVQALTRLFKSGKTEWLNCVTEEGVRFKRGVTGSTRQKKNIQVDGSSEVDEFVC